MDLLYWRRNGIKESPALTEITPQERKVYRKGFKQENVQFYPPGSNYLCSIECFNTLVALPVKNTAEARISKFS